MSKIRPVAQKPVNPPSEVALESASSALQGIQAVVQNTPGIVIAFVAILSLLLYVLGSRITPGQAILWVVAGATALAIRAWPYVGIATKRFELTAANSNRVMVSVVAGGIFLGLCLLAPLASLWPLFSGNEQAIFAAVVVGLLSVGALSLITIPHAAPIWVLLMSIVPIKFALTLSNTVGHYWPFWLLIGWVVLLVFATRKLSKTYRDLVFARSETVRQAEMVGLLLQDFGEEARDWLWETGGDCKLTFASARMADALGTTVESLLAISIEDALCDVVEASATQDVQAKQRAELIQRFKRQLPFRNQTVEYVSRGQHRWVSLSAKPLHRTNGEVAGWRGTGIDVTQEFQRQREMERLATIDSLTGLANRFLLSQTLDAIFGSVGEVSPCALLLLDLDDFKLINDHFGHPTGDRVLQLVAERLNAHVRAGQLLARLGGDEFALVAPGDIPRTRLAEMAERILNSISEPYEVDGISMSVRCSIGIAIAGIDAHDAASLLKCADLALYAAKGAGRNGLRFFGFDMYRRVEDRFTLAEEMRRALDRGEFELVYQPFVRTQTHELTGFEALVRWNHPLRGLLYPDEFVGVAEDTGLITRIGTWVLQTACVDALSWPVPVRVSVNVSPAQFAATDLLKEVNEALRLSGLPAGRLELEITESALFSDGSAARRMMQSLRNRGIHISLDDFGAGHASLNHLRTFPISRLKIDRSFTIAVADTTREGNEARSIVRAAIELARAMDFESTAEGVENKAQLEVLKGMYCDEVQGYEIAYPMTRPALAAYFAALPKKVNDEDDARASLSA